MKVLHVSQPTSEGTANVVMQLVAAGQERGHEVTVACPESGQLPFQAKAQGVQFLRLEMERGPSVRDVRALARIRRLVAAYDVVVCHSSKAGALTRMAAWLRFGPTSPVVFFPHGWSWSVGGMQGVLYRWIERVLARGAEVIVAVSRAEELEGRRNLRDPSNLRCLYNGVDTARFIPSCRERSSGLIVCVGRLARQKGQDRLLRALARCESKDLRLRLVGAGPDEISLRGLAHALGVSERVEFAGTQDPLTHLQEAEIVVVPSRWEGLSLALLESLACGAPVVATEEGASGILSDQGVVVTGTGESLVVDLARALDKLHGDPELRTVLSRRARDLAIRKFDVRRVSHEFSALVESLSAS